jgi:hypothetical protein
MGSVAQADPRSYACDRIASDTREVVPYQQFDFDETGLTVPGWSPPITAPVVSGEGAGRLYASPAYLFVVFWTDPPGIDSAVPQGPLSIAMIYRDPVAPVLTEITCTEVRP